MTLNQVIKKIEDIGNAHNQIKSTFYGSAFDFLSKGSDALYPAFIFDLNNASISGKTLSLSFSLFFMDRMLPEDTDFQDVISDQLLIAQDIIAQLSYNDFDFELEQSVTLNSFSESTPDYLAGWQTDITLDLPYIYNRCEVPSDYNYS